MHTFAHVTHRDSQDPDNQPDRRDSRIVRAPGRQELLGVFVVDPRFHEAGFDRHSDDAILEPQRADLSEPSAEDIVAEVSAQMSAPFLTRQVFVRAAISVRLLSGVAGSITKAMRLIVAGRGELDNLTFGPLLNRSLMEDR